VGKNGKQRPEGSALIVLAGVLAAGYYAFFGGPTPGPVEAAPAEQTPPMQAAPAPQQVLGVSPQGWIRPVDAPIWGGFRTPQRPDHLGVDIGAARETPIRAASAGVVVRVRCNVVPESHGCDQDGSPQIGGCGWYVDIRHDGDVYSRYCHMLRHPDVAVGQPVAAGDVIGLVGSSGNSSAPHLHFEIRVGDEDGTAIDPVPFMADRGAPLGA